MSELGIDRSHQIPDERETWRHFVRKAMRNRSFVIGAIITSVILFTALISFIWTPFDVTKLEIVNRLKKPDWVYWFGTDHFGRDMFSMIMVGSRNSIAVAFVAVAIGLAIGVPLGTLAAARKGIIEEILMRFNDLVFAFPALLSAVMITAIFGPGAVNAIIAIGIFNIPVFARLSRSAAMTIWPREYVMAARVAGKSSTRITIEHILPNIANLLIVQATIQFSLGILAEAGLSYVGLGTQPPMPSWGRMLFEAQTMIGFAPHMALFPGIAIIFTVLGLNLLGDGLRDLLDPKLRRER
ncbi:MAG: ABC transporter permease [Hyphomicrobiales bacterium]|nr:ABC transporter permease [Hyphomicrobiales bacterium]